DPYEETGTIFTKSRESFELFLRLRPHSYIFSEFLAEDYQRDVWNIWQLDINNVQSGHRFRYVVSIEYDADEIERFMMSTQPETNRRWIRVALNNGDKCFVVKISGRIVGMAWLTIAGDMARSHSVYVEPQFRRMGVMTDNLQARLIYLKSRGVKTLINEIAESNVASSGHAIKGGERMIGKMFLYNSQSDPET
ncbi:MAG: GNAT family N-acetyltransferase, partial [Nitrososphaerota archaeon]|nr:GNAT family N-acetyltransferase [Nitrososphaerota archaeon]